ncbi:ADM_collapsed_G0054600.mRNA.1.CDS.1 [Saccharomyces cerevisiae]|nr:ADM_collapsed_G0054600.mRNA.1.CDS.1 [Saccharomyces cerevisiae]
MVESRTWPIYISVLLKTKNILAITSNKGNTLLVRINDHLENEGYIEKCDYSSIEGHPYGQNNTNTEKYDRKPQIHCS